MGKFRQIFTEFSARDTPIFSLPDDNLSKLQGILTDLLYILTLWRSGLELLMGKFRQIFTEICPRHAHNFVSGR